MTGKIFLVQGDERLVELREDGYAAEEDLQLLLAQFPDLPAGDQIDGSAPRRWLLIEREVGIPDGEDASDRWAIDHIFVDQDAVPTLVEVKRSSDTRIRREVVGQMLDYAANAVAFLPVQMMQARLEARCRDQGLDVDEVIRQQLGVDDPAGLWQQVKTNLQAGRIRMLFVADVIPTELKRIVEFLNEQMDPAEVLAVEIRRYSGGEVQTLVPRLIGASAQAQSRKSAGSRPQRQWDEPSFFAALAEKVSAAEVEVAQEIYRWMQESDVRIWWGKGVQDGSINMVVDHQGREIYPLAIWTYGRVQISIEYLINAPPFDHEPHRRDLIDRFNRIPGISIPVDAFERRLRPGIPLALLRDPEAMDQFLGVLQWIVEEVRTA